MCGISAAIASNSNSVNVVIEGLEQLQNRGYDSAGIGYLDDAGFRVVKYASMTERTAIDRIKAETDQMHQNIVMGHTRWATHGPKTDNNSHPHVSSDGAVMLVHNGILENFAQLRAYLTTYGFSFMSDTDSEVIANLVAHEYSECQCPYTAIDRCVCQMQGTWGLTILFKDIPTHIYCSRHGSPILIGETIDHTLAVVASEQSAFVGVTNNYIVLDNGDICDIHKESTRVNVTTRKQYKHARCAIKSLDVLGDFAHWTLKEIHEQKHAVDRSLNFGGRLVSDVVKFGGLDANIDALRDVEHLVLLGCGTSYYAGYVANTYLKRLCRFHTVQLFDGAEFEAADIPHRGKVAVFLLSQSGETKDLHRCIDIVNKFEPSPIMIGVVNVVDSLIAREVDCGCYLHAGRERGVASTKSFTSQVIVLSLIAMWFSQLTHIKQQVRTRHLLNLRKLQSHMCETIDTAEERLRGYVDACHAARSIFVLGKGIMEGVAKEGSLKIKEISYIHAEGYSGSALKHGPFALLGPGVPVVLLINEDEHKDKMMNAYEQVKSRDALIMVLTDSEDVASATNGIQYPYNEHYSCVPCVILLQYFAYLLSCKKKINPDFPKNLAKVVTVE